MAQARRTNTPLTDIAEAIKASNDFCICGHTNPDGDCIGSTLGLTAALRALGKRACPLVADDGTIDDRYAFMPGFSDLVYAGDFKGSCTCFITVDASGKDRIGEAAFSLKEGASLTITLDHHETAAATSDLSYIDPQNPSATMIIWELAKYLGIHSTDLSMADIATCTYAGLLTDTGRFMYQNTTASAFQAAHDMVEAGASPARIAQYLFQERSLEAVKLDSLVVSNMITLAKGQVIIGAISKADMEELGASPEDAEGAINILRTIKGSKIVCVLKERDDCIRGSLRSKDGTDVASIASRFHGGGHTAAAGFTLYCTLSEAIDTMSTVLENVYSS